MSHWVYRLKDGSYLRHRQAPKAYARKATVTGTLDEARVFNSKGAALVAARPVFAGEAGVEGYPVQLDRINHL